MNYDLKVYDNANLVGELKVFDYRFFNFTYDISWLKNNESYEIDPALPLQEDSFSSNALWGAFQDISPDRWGRILQNRYHKHSLEDIEYMLSVSDYFRFGALRIAQNGKFLATHNKIPTLLNLNALAKSSLNVENEEYTNEDIEDLLNSGSSIGGARPKASVIDNNELYIAKFSSKNDEYSVILWEKSMLDLSNLANIKTAKSKLVNGINN